MHFLWFNPFFSSAVKKRESSGAQWQSSLSWSHTKTLPLRADLVTFISAWLSTQHSRAACSSLLSCDKRSHVLGTDWCYGMEHTAFSCFALLCLSDRILLLSKPLDLVWCQCLATMPAEGTARQQLLLFFWHRTLFTRTKGICLVNLAFVLLNLPVEVMCFQIILFCFCRFEQKSC